MQDGEALVEKNEIVVQKGEKLSSSLKYELSTLARQQENGSFLFFPREWLFFTAKDTSRFFGRWIQEKLAEPPTIFSEYATKESTKSMRNYLISKGYYSAAVAYDTKFNKDSSKVEIAYQVDPNQLFVIDTVNFVSQDKAIEATLLATKRQSLLKKGGAVSLDIYNNEVTRIVNYLKNNGYATFNRGFIAPLQADSTGNSINLTLEILPKSDSSNHKSYRVGEIQVFPDYDPLDSIIVVDGEAPIYRPENHINYVKDTLINGIRFFQPNWKNAIKPKHLAREIRLRSREKYSLSSENQTSNSLNSLGVFRFVSIRSEIDSLQDTILHYKIYLTRNKRLSFGSNLEFTYSDQNITRTRINLVGATASLSLKLRNAFKGAELFTNSVSFGMEFAPSSNTPPALNTIDFNVQSQLNFPRFIDYFGIWKWIGRKKKEDSLFHFLDQNANTQVGLGYNFLTRRNFYNYELFDFAFGYSAQLGGRHQLQINHLGVNYFNPSISEDSDFGLLLNNNPFLRNSFGQQFFTGALLREVNYLYSYRNIREGNQYSFSARLELSGVEVQTANGIYNRFALEETTFSIGSIDFSRYALLELDGRFTKTFNPLQSLALRFNFGIGSPFGLTEELPYVKQFFIGGPNSIRAFRAREVGPGAHCSSDLFNRICPEDGVAALDDDTPFYQTGNLKLEFNAEYRFDMFKIFSYTIEGALFAEAGNVWLTKFDENRANGQFRFTELLDENGLVINEAFYRQLALGTGFGVRLDLQYFLLRLDMGYPLHTPYEPNEAWVQQFTFEDVNYNLALNYPF